MKRRLKIDGFLATTLTFLLVYLARLFYRPKSKALDYTLDIAGMAMVIFGQIFRISARNYKKAYSKEGRTLITDGPYALSRNPMYLGTFLMGAGYIIILWPWWFLLIYVGIFYLRFANLVLSEEKKLRDNFGKEFREYLDSVPRFFPRFSDFLNIREYLPLKRQWIKKELSVIFTWFFLVAVIEGLVERENFLSPAYLKELLVLVGTFIVASAFFLSLLLKDGASKNS
jgi:protein-S-isoprenylcysteine O-methyltransferase Ste14